MKHKTAFSSKPDHPRMRAFSYVWSLPVTRQRWRSHQIYITRGDTIRSIISENTMLHANFTALSSTEPELLLIANAHRSFTLQKWEISRLFAPVTLTLRKWPSYTNDDPSRYTGWAKMNFLLYVKAFESYCITDVHATYTPNNAASQVVKKCTVNAD